MADKTAIMAVLMLELVEDQADELLLLFALNALREKRALTIRFDFDTLPDDDIFLNNFRFDKRGVVALAQELALPDVIRCEQRTIAMKLEALCIFLRRFAYPSRLSDLVPLFGRTESEMSYIIKAVTNILYERHCPQLLNLGWLTREHCARFAKAMKDKGAPVDKCWGFIDGTTLEICRPKYNQRHVFSGHKRYHCLKFQSVMTPDGIISHLFGPLEGKRHDLGLLSRSGLYPTMERIFKDYPEKYYLYGDLGYYPRPLLLSPFKGATLTADQMLVNRLMSECRICVEWGFGKIMQNFAFLDFKKNMKLYLQPVGKYYAIAAFLTNCHTCLYGSTTTTYFGLATPTLHEYIHR